MLDQAGTPARIDVRTVDFSKFDEQPGDEHITAREPSAAELEVARAVLAAVPGGADSLLYARVDLIPGPDGGPTLIELELTEPSLFLRTAPASADRLAEAILKRL